MSVWGGDRGRGRPSEFASMKRILVQFEEEEIEELKKLADFYNSQEDTQISVAKILRQLALDWVESDARKKEAVIERIIEFSQVRDT